MKVRKGGSEDNAEVLMAPLIDCVFLLLIFFLVSGTLKKAHKELEIELPHSAAAIKTKSEFDTLIVEITKDGTVYIDSQPMSKQLLHKKIREAAAEAPDRRVRIDADRATAFQYVVHTLDLLQFEGLNNIGVRARD
jgi:biopolymer transport protein ExbD